MKKQFLILVLVVAFGLTVFPQSNGNSKHADFFSRFSIELGAAPATFTDWSEVNFSFFHYAVGYRFGNRFGLKFHQDIINVYRMHPMSIQGWTIPSRLFAIGLGGIYHFKPGAGENFLCRMSYSMAVKGGITASSVTREMQSLYYDVSGRVYPVRNGYFSVGMNHDLLTDWLPPSLNNRKHIMTVYLGFGLDF